MDATTRSGKVIPNARPLVVIDHREEKIRSGIPRRNWHIPQYAPETFGLQGGELSRQGFAQRGQKEQPLTAIARACARFDQTGVEQLFKNTIKTLFRDPENVEKSGDRESGATIDKMQNAMMRPTETVSLKQPIRIADKVAVGEKEQLYKFEDLAIFRVARRGLQNCGWRGGGSSPSPGRPCRAGGLGRRRRFSMKSVGQIPDPNLRHESTMV